MNKLKLLSIMLIMVLFAGASCRKSPSQQALPSAGPNDLHASGKDTQHREQPADLSPAFARCSEVDLNSGDIRTQEYSSDGSLKATISETSLSREVRRLGIQVPEGRKWALVSAGPHPGPKGAYADGACAFVEERGGQLVQIFDKAKIPDGERRIVLEKFMMSLQTEDPHRAREQGHQLILDLAEKHGLYTYFKTRP
jgi:hypothetical protein